MTSGGGGLDFVPIGGLSGGGSVTINSNTGQFKFTLVNDGAGEGTETFTISLTMPAPGVPGTILQLATSNPITIYEVTTTTTTTTTAAPLPMPTVTIAGATSSNEGDALTVNVTTTNIPNGTTAYWNIMQSDGTTTAGDFAEPVLSFGGGSFTINGNSGSFTITSIADLKTEVNETYKINVQVTNSGGSATASTTRTLNDTSISPTLAISGPTAINEGATYTYTVTGDNKGQTTGFLNTQMLPWTINHGTTDANDFSATSGTVTLNSSLVGTFSITTAADAASEGSQTFTISINPGLNIYGGLNEASVTTPTITISDTST
jgi:hypothetical protein